MNIFCGTWRWISLVQYKDDNGTELILGIIYNGTGVLKGNVHPEGISEHYLITSITYLIRIREY